MVHVLRHRRPHRRQPLPEPDELVVLRLLLLRAVFLVVEVLPPPRRVDPVAWSFARGRGEIQTSRHAGGIASASIRASFSSSVIRFPARRRSETAPSSPAAPAPRARHRPRSNPRARTRNLAAVDTRTIVVLEGDQTGQELLEESLRVLAPDVIGLELEFPRYDLSLENRRATQNAVVHEAAAAIREHGLGLKAATITPEGRGDVGSPNRILREEIGGQVIVRTGRRIPGVVPLGGVHAPISVVRMAVGDAYGAKEWREGDGDDEVAFRTERIERRHLPRGRRVRVPAGRADGRKGLRRPEVHGQPDLRGDAEGGDGRGGGAPSRTSPYEPQLIDATFALLIASTAEPLVIPALNRDGDILSDLVLPLFGSIAGSESLLVAFDEDYVPRALMAEAAHGTAPVALRQERREPDGDDPRLRRAARARRRRARAAAGRAIREAALEAVADGIRTADLGGHAGTNEFTDEVIRRVRTKLEVWAAL